MNKLYTTIIIILALSTTISVGLLLTSTSAPGIPKSAAQTTILLPNQNEALVNTSRTDNSLTPLISSTNLRQSACNKAQDIVDRNYWSHNEPDGTTPWHFITEAGYSYTKAGENLAKDFTSPEDTVKGWLNSPTHKANIIDNFTEQGICTVKNITVQHLGRKE